MSFEPPRGLPAAFFLPASKGERFCLFHAAATPNCKGRVLYLHPFAEEMNASRRVVAQQCRALAASGYSVLQIDQLGCGESSHDFDEATWDAWSQDVLLALHWMDRHIPQQSSAPLWLWGLRAGALLACTAAGQRMAEQPNETLHLLLWQPVASGHQQLQQFMRLHAAAQWLGGSASGEAPPLALAAGRPAHVAGYNLSPELASSLEVATLDLPTTSTGRVVLLELNNTAVNHSQPSPWVRRQTDQWSNAGWEVQNQVIFAEHFWQNVGDSELDERVCRATLDALN